ncbi:DUF6526 family protein [Flavobacterium sp.]|uniref:DUF6526 family protein n=1 Tax=Flavobacterium sp. TaxID=239 RepID=UPI0039E4E353
MKQSYENHIRYYAPHHFVFYPVAAILFLISIYFVFSRPETALWIFMSVVIGLVIWVSYMMRQHYALTLQNRIVRLELRYRYFSLTGKRLEEFEHELRDSQLFSLRFAPDEEFVALVERARNEKIGGTKIKQSIVNWKGDYDRV